MIRGKLEGTRGCGGGGGGRGYRKNDEDVAWKCWRFKGVIMRWKEGKQVG